MAPANAAGPAAPDLSPPGRGGPRRAARPPEARRVGGRPAAPDGLRGRARGRHPQHRPGGLVRHEPRLAARRRHPADPARRHRRGRRRGAARAGPDRRRAAGRPGDRQARVVDHRSRWAPTPPPRSPTSPTSGTTARWPCSTCARRLEHDEERIEGAVNIPLHELADRVDEVPAGEVWVHCAAGYRASVAVSLLRALAPYASAAGRDRRHLRQRPRPRSLPLISG